MCGAMIALGRPRGMEWGGRREEGSGWGTHVYLWRIHFGVWQNQYNIVKFKNKIKIKKKRKMVKNYPKKKRKKEKKSLAHMKCAPLPKITCNKKKIRLSSGISTLSQKKMKQNT